MFPSLYWKGNVEDGDMQQVMVVAQTLGMVVLSPRQSQDRCREPTRDGSHCVELAMRWQNGHLQVHQVPAHLGAREALSFPFLLGCKGIRSPGWRRQLFGKRQQPRLQGLRCF